MEFWLRIVLVVIFAYIGMMGWLTYQRVSQQRGAFYLGLSFLVLGAMSVLPYTPRRPPVTPRHVGPRLSLTPVAPDDRVHFEFVGARTGRYYHRAACPRAENLVGPVWYESAAQARADGLSPCTECCDADDDVGRVAGAVR